MRKFVCYSLFTFISVMLSFNIAFAHKEYVDLFNSYYGTSGTDKGTTLGSCITCHNQIDGKGGYNPYGIDWKNHNDDFASIEWLDSDNDGFYNIEEINANAFPGDPNSIPGTSNQAPVSDAGSDQTLLPGDTATLNGSGSSDADGDLLSFGWAFTSMPSGSTATLSDATAVQPTFVVDLPGTYVVELIVNDGTVDSAPDTVTIATANSAPVSNAGADQTVLVGDTATLNASGSSDADGDALTYSWAFTSKPSGSTAALSDAAAVQPTFVVDLPGTYVVELVVNDGTVNSAPDTVTITTANSAPVSNAGADQTVLVGDTATLNASGSSDADGDGLTYSWAFTSMPSGSAAALSDAAAVQPTFVVDLPGTYVAALVVNDGTVDSAPDTVTITTANSAPVSNAGADQTALVGDTATLNASGSSDADGDALTYSWAFTSMPSGSAAALSDAAAVQPTFVVDLPGTYVAALVVNDGKVDSAPDTVTITTANSAPVSNAGPDQTVLVGDTATLNASGSSDADGDGLIYSWAFTSRPSGSTAALSDAAAVQPTFVVDLPGTYVVALVVNDGKVDSAPDTVTIATENSMPVANAGPDQTVLPGATATLDASGSSDADGDGLTYSWAFTSRPSGSTAALSDAAAVQPFFVVDLPGTYVVALVVNDGKVDSAPDTVTITTANSAPVSNAGADQTVLVGDTATLNASGSSDADGDALTYSWAFTSMPSGSAAALSDAAAVQPSFVVDLPGTYVAALVVNDGTVDSAPDTVTITTANSAPVSNAGPDQTVLVGDTPTLNASGSSDVDGDALTYSWAFTSIPSGSTATLSDATAVQPFFVVDLPGTYVVSLVVNDGKVDSAPDTVTISTENSMPVANAGLDQTVLPGATATLDASGSSDGDGDALTYSWAFTSRPSGSAAALSDAAAVQPTFVVDLPGTYVVALVVNDGTVDSAPDTVTITTANSAPVSNAGPDQTVLVGDTATLNAGGSSDADGDALTYTWAFTSKPSGSAAALSDAAAVQPTFVVDLPGTYVVALVVNDGKVDSAPDTVAISTENSMPIADAGKRQTAQCGAVLMLDGGGSSDADGDPLAYSWSYSSIPSGSSAVLSDPTAMQPTFVPDADGTYVIQLIVNDGMVDSAPDSAIVKVNRCGNQGTGGGKGNGNGNGKGGPKNSDS